MNALDTVKALVASGDIYYHQSVDAVGGPQGSASLLVSEAAADQLEAAGVSIIRTHVNHNPLISRTSLAETLGGESEVVTVLKDVQTKEEGPVKWLGRGAKEALEMHPEQGIGGR